MQNISIRMERPNFRTAVYNGINYNHSLLGYLCYLYPTLEIYNKYDNSWIDYYSKKFPHINSDNNFEDFEKNITSFSVIFLLNDDDYSFPVKWLKKYQLWDKIIKIKQVNANRNIAIPRYINIRNSRDDEEKYAIPCFPLTETNIKLMPIKVLAVKSLMNHYDQTELTFLQNYLKDNLIILDDVSPEQIINTMSKCHYFYYGLVKNSYLNRATLSMYVYLSLSCGMQILMKKYTNRQLKIEASRTYREITEILPLPFYFDSNRAFKECKKNINRFTTIVNNYLKDQRLITTNLITTTDKSFIPSQIEISVLLLLLGLTVLIILLRKQR